LAASKFCDGLIGFVMGRAGTRFRLPAQARLRKVYRTLRSSGTRTQERGTNMNRKAYLQELMTIYGSIPEQRRPEFSQIFLEKEKNPVVAFGWNAWLGYLGADKFYLGSVLLGLLKLFTFGAFGIWVFIDLFLVAGAARDKSIAAARELRDSMRV
jgi:hypothetical protein